MSKKPGKEKIERFVSGFLRESMNTSINACINQLNAGGHRFKPVDEHLCEWQEPGSDKRLSIHGVVGVSYKEQDGSQPVFDPIVDSFIKLAESGEDREATMLNLLEGDIYNGGFFQLYDNKGIRFIRQAASLLAKTGSKSTLRLVKQAIAAIEENETLLRDHKRLQKKLYKLDCRFYDLKESIPVLFMQYRKKNR